MNIQTFFDDEVKRKSLCSSKEDNQDRCFLLQLKIQAKTSATDRQPVPEKVPIHE
jgi:hypothetical protein